MKHAGSGLGIERKLSSRTDRPFIVNFNKVNTTTTVAVETAINDKTVTVADSTGFALGNYLIIYSSVTDRFFTGRILSIVGNVLTIDNPLDSAFPVGAIASASITNMAVDGSATTQVFGIRGIPVVNPLNVTFHITRIIFNCQTDGTVDLSTFADQSALTNGLVLRKRNGEYDNIFNIKTNGELDGITLDWNPYSASNPNRGQNGFTSRLTFNGQDKMGTVIELSEGSDMEFLVQDDLSGIELLEVVAEGYSFRSI